MCGWGPSPVGCSCAEQNYVVPLRVGDVQSRCARPLWPVVLGEELQFIIAGRTPMKIVDHGRVVQSLRLEGDTDSCSRYGRL